MVQTSVMFGERVVVDPDWDQGLSKEIVDYLLSSNPLPDPCRMAAPRKPFVMPVMIANTSVKLIKQEVKDFVLTTVVAHEENSIGIDEIRGHIKILFKRKFDDRDTVLNKIIDEAIKELNEQETESDEEGLSSRSTDPAVAPPRSPPLVRINVLDPAHDTAEGRRIVEALKGIFEDGTAVTDVQVLQKLQAEMDISNFLKKLDKLDMSMTDLIAFYRREAMESAEDQVEALMKGEQLLPAMISGTEITDLMLTPAEEKRCKELTKLVKIFPDDSLEKETGVSRITVAEELIETYNSQEFATESLFIKAVIKKLFLGSLKEKKMDAVTAKCLPRFLLKAWRLLQRDEGHRLRERKRMFSTDKKVRIKTEPIWEGPKDESVILIDLTEDEKSKKRKKRTKRRDEKRRKVETPRKPPSEDEAPDREPAPAEAPGEEKDQVPVAEEVTAAEGHPGTREELEGEDTGRDGQETEDSLDLLEDPDDLMPLTREQKEELEAHVMNCMQGTAYLDVDLAGVLGYLQAAVPGGVEGTGMDYGQSKGQVAKMMIRCRNRRVAEEKERMRKLFEDFQNQERQMGGRSAPELRSGRRPNIPTHRSGSKKSAPVDRSEGNQSAPEKRPEGKSAPTPKADDDEGRPGERQQEKRAPTERSEADRNAPVVKPTEGLGGQAEENLGEIDEQPDEGGDEDPGEDSQLLTSFVGDEPPLFQSSTVEELREPRATKSARKSLLPAFQLDPESDIVPIEAFKKVAKTTQIEVFEGTPLSREQLIEEAWAKVVRLAPRLGRLSQENKDGHKEKLGRVIDNAREAVELGLNTTLPEGIEQIELRREIRNLMEEDDYLELTLGMVVFEMEERFKVNLLGAVGLIKQLMANEKFRRAAMAKREDVEPLVGRAAQGEIDWSAIKKRVEDLLRAGNNLLLMTDNEILISVANFCRVRTEDLRKEKSKLVDIIKEVRTKIQGKRKIKKTVQAPPRRRGKDREENWRQEAMRVNQSLDRTGKGKRRGPTQATAALAKELAKQAVEQAFRDQTEEPCINPREFMREARRVAMGLWQDKGEDRVENKPTFTTYALAALQEAYEDYAKKFFACVQVAADHRRTPNEIKKRAIKTIMDRDIDLVVKLRSMDK